jgi:diguanylate cyclase (GGDEF)-like protein
VDSTVLVLVLAAAVLATALASAAVVALLRLRSPPSAPRPRKAAPETAEDWTAGIEGDGQMRRAVERAQRDAVRARKLAALFGTLDLDELLLRVLETAVGLTGADAAAVALDQGTGPPLETRFGLAAHEAAPSLDSLHGESRARSVTLDYRYAATEESGSEDPLRRGVVVPIPATAEDGSLGALAVYWRRDVDDLNDDELAALEELARNSARAIENARRYKAVHDLAELDPLSGLYNRRYFEDTLAREVKRAQRYRRRLALLVFDVDGLKAINDEHGHLAGDALLLEAADRLRSVTRGADVACRVGGDEFAVILPESTVADAQQLHERLGRVLRAGAAGPVDRIEISAGIAQLRPDERGVEFFDRADQALLNAKRSGRGRLEVADEPEADEANAD